MDLLLIRHGLPLRIELAQGEQADPPLAPLGHAQAQALADWLVYERIDALYVSPLTRARETAAPLAERTGLEAVVVEGVAEFDRDSHEYIPIEELRASADPRLTDLTEGWFFQKAGISLDEFRQRVIGALEEIVAANRGRTAAVVCHGGILNVWLTHLLGIDAFPIVEPGYTSVSRFRCSSQGHRSMLSINETSHLRGVG